MKDNYLEIIKKIGEDPNRSGLIKSPERAAKAMEFLTQGYSQNIEEVINHALFPADVDEMVIIKDIELYSLCEHHLLPFYGKCHVGYLPQGKVIGVSKIARVVDLYARRLQIQEQLTTQIAEALLNHICAQGVGVIIEASHLCMMMRGVQKQNSILKTSCMLGVFKEERTRLEFLHLIKN